ncbi:MAG: DUF3488 and transglutaminase-like domain-containing protein [Marinobacter sp.]|uniref:transglutaminase family protein n=1 Tax=Marinobacter sp. TaxID=50741 RepID=UPI00299DC8E4|nr:DUF3488 and transglutaminase-like domain-containing protein [Marinobacter sp.]MDX1633145.1 DUF3488 and transglutaminase-like domain-containing protein [Marinobacter sp.]
MTGHRDDLPQRALIWLIVAFGILVLPQWDRLPVWLMAVCALLAGWRWLAQRGRLRLPGRLLRTTIMLTMVGIYVLTVNARFSVDTAASFFVLAVGLKWLETRTSRDFYVLFFILIYLATVNFLFQQGIGWTLVNLAGVTLLFIGLQVLNAPQLRSPGLSGLRRLGLMLVKTLPIVVLLFVFFPRMGPLWSVPLVSGQGQTGISDTMSPGSISNLAQSSERAFRVTFGGIMPPQRERYWRGLILDRYDGDTWRQGDPLPYRPPGRINLDGGAGDLLPDQYEVLLDPTNQRWAFALDDSQAVSDNLEAVEGGLFRFRRPADTTVRYRLALTANDNADDTAGLSNRERQRYLQLPAEGNRRTRALARELRQQSNGPEELVLTFLGRLRTEAYFYTLRPPVMLEDGIDALLFDVRRGFCAHYAGAMTFLLRSAGIPARVVVGYQGGEAGVDDEYLIVRQYDAHAWVEAWLPERGWARIDPTAAIAPQRIESGLREAVAEEGSFLENDWTSPQRYGDLALVQWASLRLDQLNYHWTRWVVGYQGQTQRSLMSNLPGDLSMRELGYVTAGLVSAALALAGLITLLRQRANRPADPVQRLLLQWQRLLARHGVPVEPGQTPDQTARRAMMRFPAAEKPLLAFAAQVNNHYYKPSARPARPQISLLRRLLKATRRELGRKRPEAGRIPRIQTG